MLAKRPTPCNLARGLTRPVHGRKRIYVRVGRSHTLFFHNIFPTMSNVPSFAERKQPGVLCLFDVDGTLTPARQQVSDEMLDVLKALREHVAIGFVGGSDLSKIREQLQLAGHEDIVHQFDYGFAENGLTAYRLGSQLPSQSFINWLGEEKYKKFVKFVLAYISQLDIPVMRGTFVEFR